jgi:hypothetical protein
MLYAVIVTGKEMRSGAEGNPIVGREGERYWVCEDHWGDTSSRCTDPARVAGDVKLFKTEAAATAFAQRWSGHPWWCSPTGEFEVVEIRPRYRKVLVGYERSDPTTRR